MRFNGGAALPWSRVERILSGRPGPIPVSVEHLPDATDAPKAGYSAVPFAELHAVSSYSFLQGASEPEELVARAVELGLRGMALVDRDGFYGLMKFAEAAAKVGLPAVFGAELSLEPAPLTVLARTPEGYRRLSRLISRARMEAGEKDAVVYPPLADIAAELQEHCFFLVGWEWAEKFDYLSERIKIDSMVLEYSCTQVPEDVDHHALLDSCPVPRAIATARPAAATREHARLAGAKQALSRRLALADASPNSHPMGSSWLRSGEQMAQLFPDRPELIAETVRVLEDCSFTWEALAPNLPDFDVPEGHTEMSWLEHLTFERAKARYATRPKEIRERAWEQMRYELGVVKQLGFPGYFLIVCDFVDFCRRENILCQGRGSAANSAVCFALGITNAEPISAGLLFERFLSPDRDGPPDIDIDIESGRREEVIQYVYATHGRERAAQVANVITYRRKGALRDAARALGYPQGSADAWSKGIAPAPDDVESLAEQFLGQPRHLGIHSGGMVLCDRPIADVVPVEWARMENRSVLQWDKDDCAAAGLVKFDMLGLGMLEALHHMMDLVEETTGRKVNLWELDLADPEVYDMLCRADAVGVFQVESRAQLNTLPRLKPRVFFDLVVEVALIRPGPIQGGSVHPYLRRRDGKEPVEYDHPVLEKSLGKTLGIPLFQEQLMQIAVDAAGFSGAEADDLRRAMGSKRSPAKMAALKQRFYDGLQETNGIAGEVADKLWAKIVAFAAYGFPESHSQSFASLVYFSAWFKRYYPAQFCVGLLRAQPMGFYSPQSLIQDARRHGVEVLPATVNDSGREARAVVGKDGQVRIRLGLNLIKGLGDKAADRIEAAAPFADVPDLSRRADLTVDHVEALAVAGALDVFGVDRRQALWQAGVAATEQAGMLPGLSAIEAPSLPGMSAFELMAADVASTGVTHNQQPMEQIRGALRARGVLSAADLPAVEDGTRVRIAGVVTHRQRPQTAAGVVFFGLEDETGLMNVMVSPGLWARDKVTARTAPALIVRGIVQNASGAVTVAADQLEPLAFGEALSRGSRDFR
ncbi:error-prone DNA polymerase [Corynebacterium minutissimum]|uniref:Error-prone DNA polymerase n=2 Tax=Bacteria TaxID=2 RepID=A0A376CT67_9CORY|nr:error-prone DNA polymerase [Corynebacterium minutissimum]QRP60195.1 error-prone DNA polymerase [Corynebacterium minutissimum]STC74883.1 error-prone DNA polymerase [Corynebacterium minutissimum]